MPRATWNNVVIAESEDVAVVDGYTYFPKSAVRRELLEQSNRTSVCPWKGEANYYSLNVNGQRNADAAWEYRDPKPAAAAVRDRIAFWRGVRVEP
ncbi:MAG: DUF427 domain-containing protein [Gemmatimonadaceae bacterium]|nr:DUF427 domain-containing protein [Gemmatimonadaceae bacterium]NUO95645.1 DUF427 domain-containing protein [Gemmatimonadaceae bacterium]NUP56598.1 DUF427 domain-containing protein [Gemmatimonadaceae bacterium]NUR35719.1 DUF427 domain-containing protein [Gemmatimonadaceae bacterium]